MRTAAALLILAIISVPVLLILIALTYGREAEWVKNVLAAHGAQLETQGKHYDLSAPAIVHDPSRQNFPPVVRTVLWLIGANDFMQLFTTGPKPAVE